MNREFLALEGRPYVEGDQDCYGLFRAYFKKVYDLHLSNYARPFGFAYQGLNLLGENVNKEGFEFIDTHLSRLEVGDGLLMSLASAPYANHIGVYVGNNMILHHLFSGRSIAEDFNIKWRARVLNVIRHPLVTEKNKYRPVEKVIIKPPHVPNKLPS